MPLRRPQSGVTCSYRVQTSHRGWRNTSTEARHKAGVRTSGARTVHLRFAMQNPDPKVEPETPQPTPASPYPEPARPPTPPETPQPDLPPELPSPLPEQVPRPGTEPIGVPPTSPPEIPVTPSTTPLPTAYQSSPRLLGFPCLRVIGPGDADARL
jgi:hypothetical protein